MYYNQRGVSMFFKPSKQHKAQSAMEYLMTYGWAILIIAVVLGALFSLGVFSGSNLLGNACVAGSGYLCKSPFFNHGNAGIQLVVGQNTGTTWSSSNFIFVPEGTPTNAGTGLPTSLTFNVLGTAGQANTTYGGAGAGLISGQTVTIWLPVNGVTAPVTVGTPATGAIWVEYTTSGNAAPQYAQLASINIKAS
jgi:hypothetical protein